MTSALYYSNLLGTCILLAHWIANAQYYSLSVSDFPQFYMAYSGKIIYLNLALKQCERSTNANNRCAPSNSKMLESTKEVFFYWIIFRQLYAKIALSNN